MMLVAISNIWGRPFIDFEKYVDVSRFKELDDEICYSMTQLPLEYTGGSHRTLGIVPPSKLNEPWADYGEVIRGFSMEEFATFASLSDTPDDFDLERRHEYTFGEEGEFMLSRKQMAFLKYKHKVYFPWQAFYEMIPTENWADKSHGAGKAFTTQAQRFFPKLIEFVRSLPFMQVGRCNILGLDPYHHGTIHQDGDINDPFADHFITINPGRPKRLFLWDEENQTKHVIESRAYWFNDHGYHGVDADPWFRYSVRIDGVFEPAFFERLRKDHGA